MSPPGPRPGDEQPLAFDAIDYGVIERIEGASSLRKTRTPH
jgi:hypothetical protein